MLSPQETITPDERERGLRFLLIDAAAATAIGALNSGVVLLALALHIGATGVQIGILAAVPLLTQVLQAPTVKLVEHVRKRRLISVAAVFGARLALPVYAAVPFVADRDVAVATLIAAALVHYGLNAIGACTWNSWMRDLIPPDRLGRFFSRRAFYGTLVSVVATVAAAGALALAGGSRGAGDRVFCALYLFGFACGLLSTASLARVPEPQMPPPGPTAPLHRLLWHPLRDRNFGNMLRYLASWQFAVNLATPFFTVYLVRELGFSMSFVLMLSVVSQLANVAVIRGWGALGDRFSNKSILATATPLFIASILGISLTSQIAGTEARVAYLALLHVAMGAAGAGVGLASGNIVMKLSPAGSATSYMATTALVGAVAAGLAPVVGGLTADFFARRRIALHVDWSSPRGTSEVFGLMFTHWEFFFLLSSLLGLYALHRLATVHEPGEVERREVVGHIWTSARRTLRNVSSVAGLRLAVSFPGADLIKSRERPPFMLEYLFGQHREGDKPASPAATIGTLLGASFGTAPTDDRMEALLGELRDIDRRRD
ncbi:MFS transporter [uncultured Sphingomonas sp.]|uniref:MFS transporter n=1 Tax=uncultured Sphingomonas sp. TaxID=158754 RepID=UPI0035C97579